MSQNPTQWVRIKQQRLQTSCKPFGRLENFADISAQRAKGMKAIKTHQAEWFATGTALCDSARQRARRLSIPHCEQHGFDISKLCIAMVSNIFPWQTPERLAEADSLSICSLGVWRRISLLNSSLIVRRGYSGRKINALPVNCELRWMVASCNKIYIQNKDQPFKVTE